MDYARIANRLPGWKNALSALLSAGLLILAFPDFDFWFLAWFALVPLMWAVEREKESPLKSFILGWIFGTAFFFGTCWWLTYAPITYAGFPPILAYSLFFCVAAVAGLFPGLFAAILSLQLRRLGPAGIGNALWIWPFTEFLRYWITGNNWNALGYSQAFSPFKVFAADGGVHLVGALLIALNSLIVGVFLIFRQVGVAERRIYFLAAGGFLFFGLLCAVLWIIPYQPEPPKNREGSIVIALQPNVPMSGLSEQKWSDLRQRHVRLAETALTELNEQLTTDNRQPTTVIFPESPMNFMYETDVETREFIDGFARKNDVSVLFNSAEPEPAINGMVISPTRFYNSAVMVGPEGREIGQYDKIYLLPFGESVPAPLRSIVPAFVGSFSYGSEYDLLPMGDAKAGVMICFESHFGQLSREYVRNGADVIIEMTNDGYLGPTPVLRQHLANAVFRAVETNRPVLRVTNVGITAYINERGEVLDAAAPYTEDTRVWSVSKSDGSQTFYVRYGDWFAWLCSVVTVGLLLFAIARRLAET